MKTTMICGAALAMCLDLLAGCDQVTSIGDRADGGREASDGGEAFECDRPICGNYVFPPSPRLVRVERRRPMEESPVNRVDLQYNAAGELVSEDEMATEATRYAYSDGQLTLIEEFRHGVKRLESSLSWQGSRFLGREGWTELRDGEGRLRFSERRTFGPLGLEAVRRSFVAVDGTIKESQVMINYGSTGAVDSVSSVGESGHHTDVAFYYEGDRMSRMRVTHESISEIDQIDFDYDSNGRVTSATGRGMVHRYFYNASGLIARIESQGTTEPTTFDFIYEPGTTPSIQFHHAGMVTLRGEVSPLISVANYSTNIDPALWWIYP